MLTPLSLLGRNISSAQPLTSETNASKQVPIGPQPALIPTTGIKIFDEISKDMADNQPPTADSNVLVKFDSIGIGPGLTPSDTKNDTIRMALENGIAEGEKIIDTKVKNLGMKVNGWLVNLDVGNYVLIIFYVQRLQNLDLVLTLQRRLFTLVHLSITMVKT